MSKKKFSVTIESSILDSIDWLAEEVGLSRSQTLEYIAMHWMRHQHPTHERHEWEYSYLGSDELWLSFEHHERARHEDMINERFGSDED